MTPRPTATRLPTLAGLLELVAARRGHFLLESGHHGGLWLELDGLFADASRVEPFVSALISAIRPRGIDAVCGPLLGGAFLAQSVARELGVDFCFTERVMAAPSRGLYEARYQLPAALAGRLGGKRVAMVDDVMSAGSALRGTYTELLAHGAIPVVAGALLVLGATGASFFAERGIPVEAAVRDDYQLWEPTDCTLCQRGLPLEDVRSLRS